MNLPSFGRSVQALGFCLAQGGLCCGSSCGNFRPPYTRADSEIAVPACILAHMKKSEKKEKKKKVWEEDRKKMLVDCEVTRGKATGNYAEENILTSE